MLKDNWSSHNVHQSQFYNLCFVRFLKKHFEIGTNKKSSTKDLTLKTLEVVLNVFDRFYATYLGYESNLQYLLIYIKCIFICSSILEKDAKLMQK